MLTVGVENDPGHSALCMVCPLDAEEVHERLYVVLWENSMPFPQEFYTRTGGCLRLCELHADELLILLSEALP